MSAANLMFQALAAQQGRRLDDAERLYRSALAIDANLADALHMLGVVRMELEDIEEAARLIRRALVLSEWQFPDFAHNYSLVLAKKAHALGWNAISNIGRQYRSRERRVETPNPSYPLVSVIVPCFNHEPFLRFALESVFAQSYQNIEVIAIDDGSTDGSTALLRRLKDESPFPFKLICRENRGAPATLNEASTLAEGAWIQPLNSDDAFAADRIETMLRDVAQSGALWGYGCVTPIDKLNQALDPMTHAYAFGVLCAQSEVSLRETLSEAFFSSNPSISTGNLFVSTELLHKLGGFREFRYNHDWDFCLRAAAQSEPVYSKTASYLYRLHDYNTINERGTAKQSEADTLMREHIALSLSDAEPVNEWYPTYKRRGDEFVAYLLVSGVGKLIPRDILEKVGDKLFPEISHK